MRGHTNIKGANLSGQRSEVYRYAKTLLNEFSSKVLDLTALIAFLALRFVVGHKRQQ